MLVFFVLAGLYESWSPPWSVILVVPMCLLSALVGLALAQYDVNIFVQVGFVVLVGLAAKNAILIVEFARDRQHEGASLFDAAVEAARERLRPILMTSFAFILGVFPLVIADGAGAEMRRTLGTAVFAGMIGVTLFGLFLTPVFFYVIRGLAQRRTPAREPATPVPSATANGDTGPERAGRPVGRRKGRAPFSCACWRAHRRGALARSCGCPAGTSVKLGDQRVVAGPIELSVRHRAVGPRKLKLAVCPAGIMMPVWPRNVPFTNPRTTRKPCSGGR